MTIQDHWNSRTLKEAILSYMRDSNQDYLCLYSSEWCEAIGEHVGGWEELGKLTSIRLGLFFRQLVKSSENGVELVIRRDYNESTTRWEARLIK